MLSVIIPSRNELFLDNTIHDVLTKATGDIEVIPILDGYDAPRIEDSRVRYVHFENRKGMRAGINAGLEIAKGDYIMKSDAHCMYEPGFDEKLKMDCDDNWVVIPLRHRLDAKLWDFQPTTKPPFCYAYLDNPFRPERFFGNVNWLAKDRDPKLKDILIDDTMSFQGSCWFAKKKHLERIKVFETEHYWGWEQEPQELGNKTWLSGGRVVVNKKVWYAHLHKGSTWGRMYYMNKYAIEAGHRYSTDYWINNRWEGQIHKFEWLVDKFWPIPTWKDNWKEDKLENYA